MNASFLASLRPVTVGSVIESRSRGHSQLSSHFFPKSVKKLMRSTLGRRIFLAHLQLSYQLGRRITLAEFGRLIAKQLGRKTPFVATAVSRWEAGLQIPTPEVIEAIAELSGVDPGWISHGEKSAAPSPAAFPSEPPSREPTVPEAGGPSGRTRAKDGAKGRQLDRDKRRR